MKFFLSVLLGLCIGISSLMGQQKSTAIENPNLGKLVELQTFGCYGFCPMYKLSISDDGVVDYEGLAFVAKIGKSQTKLKSGELSRLKSTIQQVNLWQYPDTFRTQIVDAPSARIAVYDLKRGMKSVYGSIDRPGPVLELEEYIKTLAEAHGLKVKKGVMPIKSDSKVALSTKSMPDAKDGIEAIANQVVVQLKMKKTPEQLATEFKDVKLMVAEVLPQMDRYLMNFDASVIGSDALLKRLRASSLVVSAALPYTPPVKKGKS